MTFSHLFIEFSRSKLLNEYWPRLRTSVQSLSDDQMWWRPNEASNSIGNYHVVEHFGMHLGQILYITKLLRGEDLGFYKELDNTGRLEL
jgi:hypothetical protein